MLKRLTIEQIIEEPWNIFHMPKEEITYEVCLAASLHARGRLHTDRSILEAMPQEFKTDEVCFNCIQRDGNAFSFVPQKLRSRELSLLAVSIDGRMLGYVPEELIDYEMCMTALKETGRAIFDVPKILVNGDMLLEAVRSYPEAILRIPDHIPAALLNAEICERALRYGYRELEELVTDSTGELLELCFHLAGDRITLSEKALTYAKTYGIIITGYNDVGGEG